MLIASDDASLVEQAYGEKPEDGKVWLDGVLSRKKQVVPPLQDAFKGQVRDSRFEIRDSRNLKTLRLTAQGFFMPADGFIPRQYQEQGARSSWLVARPLRYKDPPTLKYLLYLPIK